MNCNRAFCFKNVRHYYYDDYAKNMTLFEIESHRSEPTANSISDPVKHRTIHHPEGNLSDVAPLKNPLLPVLVVLLEPPLDPTGAHQYKLAGRHSKWRDNQQEEEQVQRVRCREGCWLVTEQLCHWDHRVKANYQINSGEANAGWHDHGGYRLKAEEVSVWVRRRRYYEELARDHCNFIINIILSCHNYS